ncbi:MAG: type VI secretion system tip protein VgrG [Holosporaceae bacterium]|jgi:type VI secretion system secreted protein VgrG|nr:type VI secretion system tip protein VgrG [Holosporaceae bacterium]
MFSVLQNQGNLLAQLTTVFGSSDVVIKSIRGIEAISELFEFIVVFQAKETSLDLDKALGSSISITLKTEKQERHINGIVAEFSHIASVQKTDGYVTEYSAVIRPKLWLLTLDRNHLIFQKQTAIDIISKVLKDNGITDLDDKTKSCGKVAREYCVQYGESSFNFISRLMEDEGIFYFFTHEKNKHTLVLADSSSVHEKIPNPKVGFVQGFNEAVAMGKIFDTSMTTAVNTGDYSIADYNYTVSETKLFSKLSSKWKGQMYYEYPGKYEKVKEGDDLSKLRVELFERNHCVFRASSTVAELTPGMLFEVTGHHFSKFNAEYTVYGVEHFFDYSPPSQMSYRNRVQAFPKNVTFRPDRSTLKPKIYGTQTAIVTCPSGEEISRDKYCCVKVHFYWDQIGKDKDTEDSSCWIRVAQLLAGNSWGAIFVPRVGQEVVVAFQEGDPDRPLIVGCVYNDKHVPLYPEGEAMKSSLKTVTFKDDEKGFNEFRLNDEKDKEEIYLHAQKDMVIDIINSRTTTIEESNDVLDILKGSRTITLQAKGDDKANHSITLTKGDKSVELTEGNYAITLSKGNETVELKEGDYTIKLSKGNMTVTLSGDLKIKADGAIEIESGKAMKIKSGQDMTIESGTKINMKSGTDFGLKAGTALTEESGTDLKLKSGTNFTGEAGVNMTLKATMNLEASATMGMTLKANTTWEAQGMISAKLSGTIAELAGNGMSKVGAPMITIGGGMVQLG